MIKGPGAYLRRGHPRARKRRFYASQGPEIQELYLEDGVVTSNVPRRSIFPTPRVSGATRRGLEYDGYLEEASFAVDPGDVYFRISVVDDRGRHADTRAYFLDTL